MLAIIDTGGKETAPMITLRPRFAVAAVGVRTPDPVATVVGIGTEI